MLPSQGSKIQGWERVAVFLLLRKFFFFCGGGGWAICPSFASSQMEQHNQDHLDKMWTFFLLKRQTLTFQSVKNWGLTKCQSTTGTSTALSALELIWKLGTLKTHRCYTVPIQCIKMCHNVFSTKISCQGWRWTRWWQPWVWRGGHRPVHCRGEADLDIYIMMKCLSVTKMITSELTTRGAKRDAC